ncbi:hypothetical protein H4R19_000400 [Coemansia spiralis]|nr:hypothetical protein H4R19_000400 [Coemansia spiralis]
MHITRLVGVGLLGLVGTRADTPGTKTVVISLATGSHGEIIPIVLHGTGTSHELPQASESSIDILGASPLSESASTPAPLAGAPADQQPEEQSSLSQTDMSSVSEAGPLSEFISGVVESFVEQVSLDSDLSAESEEPSASEAGSAPEDAAHESDSDSDSDERPAPSKAGSSGADASRPGPWGVPIALCIGAVAANLSRM